VATTEIDIVGHPFFQQEPSASTTPIYYSAEEFRNYTDSMHRRPGVLGTTHMTVTQATNIGFKIKVANGYALMGGYIVDLPDDTEVDMPWAKPPTGTRTHKVFIAVYDQLAASPVSKARIVATEDTGSGAPNPAGAVAYHELATIKVSSTQANIQNVNITNTAQHGGSMGDYFILDSYTTGSYASGGSDAPGGQAHFRAIHNAGVVRLSGRLVRFDGSDFPSNVELHICTLPKHLWPKHLLYLTGTSSDAGPNSGPSGTMTFRLTIFADGIMKVRTPSTQSPQHLFFDGMSYDLD